MENYHNSTTTEPVVLAIQLEGLEKEIADWLYEGFQLFVLECEQFSFGFGVCAWSDAQGSGGSKTGSAGSIGGGKLRGGC